MRGHCVLLAPRGDLPVGKAEALACQAKVFGCRHKGVKLGHVGQIPDHAVGCRFTEYHTLAVDKNLAAVYLHKT